MLIAATDRGLCRISFDESEADLRRRFPHADIQAADEAFAALAADVVALADDPARAANLPLDVAGTAFQQSVWEALRAIPPGETRSYKQVAAAVGRPDAVRAAGTACGDNNLALLIPCHRVLRSDGGLGGYAYGLERKRALLARERGDSCGDKGA
jgi:AraC family transcriptional regulator of adaptative response/methylated-DNA-[protein]-cysteine methyltransferase